MIQRILNLLLVLSALVLPVEARAETIVRGPYLHMGAPDAMTVVWRTDVATDGVLRVGTSPDALDTTVTSTAGSATQHEVRVDGLSAATTYYYAVGTAEAVLAGGDADHHFTTSPPQGTSTPFRAWIVGDSGTGDGRQGAVIGAMLHETVGNPPDLFLHLGDMAYSEGKDAEFQEKFFEMHFLVLRDTPIWPTMGNHEGKSSQSGPQTGPYYDAYVLPKNAEVGGVASGTEAYYSYDYANVHFIVLDSHDSPRAPDGAMATWLKADLAATTQDWLIAYWHHPPYTKGSHDSDTEGSHIEMRENILPILESAGVDLVLGGHSHIYERSYLVDGAYDTPTTATGHLVDTGDGRALGDGPYVKADASAPGAVYIVAGHGGARIDVDSPGDHPVMFFAEKALGSVLMDVEGNTLTLTNIRHDFAHTDTVSLVKGEGFVLAEPAGGERFGEGATVTLKWATVGTAPSVDLHYSVDGGATWTAIATGVSNTGTYDWTVPAETSTDAWVRVSDSAGTLSPDRNPGRFTLYTGADPGRSNRAPVLLPFGPMEADPGSLILLNVRAIDPDGDPIEIYMSGLPAVANLDLGLFSWVPTGDDVGWHVAHFFAEDDQGAVGELEVLFGIRDADGNLPPPPDTSGGDTDGGATDAGGGGGGGSGCGCSPAGGFGAGVALLLVLLFALVLRRRTA